MKSERISIFNYEAFYLDHLEGTLGEEDTVLLLDFLAVHPDLMVDAEDFLLLDPKNDTSIFADKDSLKMVSDGAAIVLSNVEHFLVAEAEGQLNSSKIAELQSFVQQYPHLETERALLATLFLRADESIVYTDKAGLKRKGAIVFWPYFALAAASVLIAFLFAMNNDSENRVVADGDKDKFSPQKELPQQKSPTDLKENLQLAKDVIPVENGIQHTEIGSKKKRNECKQIEENRTLANVNSIKTKSPRRMINSINVDNLQPIASLISPPTHQGILEDDRAQVASPEMKNPIKPITNSLQKTLKTPVDFQTGKAANNSGGGFFLKIGKLEISRKKGKN